MNTITIELCAEDRARLDRIAESLELLRGPIVMGEPIPLDPQPEPTPQDLTPEVVTSDVQAVVDTQPEPAAEPEPVKAPELKKVTTPADVMAVLQPMLAPGSKKRAAAREIVLKYAPKVSAIPADKLDEVLGRLKALADDVEAGI